MRVKIGKYKKNGDRKVEVEIKRYDLWSLDYTLALVILPALKEFRKNADLWDEDWLHTLDEMIWAFGQVVKDGEGDHLLEDPDRVDAGLLLFGIHYRKLWT